MFDHIVAMNDPEIISFRILDQTGVIQLREIEIIGQKSLESLYLINNFLQNETNNRIKSNKGMSL
jgi:hypothetical protein